MTRIDDPNQVESQNRDVASQMLAIVLNVAAPVIGLLTTDQAGAIAAIAAFTAEFLGNQRQQANAEALQHGLKEGARDLNGRLDAVERKLVGLDAQEAVIVAVRQTLFTARADKARAFGRIVGATLVDDAPNWQEAAEFIRNLEEFSNADLEALGILWKVQRQAYRVVTDGRREMSTDANDYTRTWTGVLDHAGKAGLSKDDWYSRCARLSGFGLTVLVQSNSNFQGPDSMCYRLTGRAVRLLTLLGRNLGDPLKYPRVRYHATKPCVTVEDEEAERALGEGWADTPAFEKH